MRTLVVIIAALILVAALFSPASGQAGITITGADQLRDLASTGNSGITTAAAEVMARIQFDSPNTIRIIPLPELPGALVDELAEVPYRLYLPLIRLT